ncbi:DEAD/DEAH box helicase family protein [Nakamurella alba]|uniref:DEAD/DEAH box helicase family protein n=1 Tax=Nakamurella alba TaxID=2665158 RepID=UPI001E60AEFD|nr:DEAD/DEAH box helicase family protein [Nakamurella alba]
MNELTLSGASWQAFERLVVRLLLSRGYTQVRLAGSSGDGGADVTANLNGKRWLFQCKRWRNAVGIATVDETLQAMHTYGADVPVVVSRNGFTTDVRELQRRLALAGTPLQLWDSSSLLKLIKRCRPEPITQQDPERYELRDYQRRAVEAVMNDRFRGARSALLVLATGLGKTHIAAETLREITKANGPVRTLVLAHRNELVYQLEKAFWPSLTAEQATAIWNGVERPDVDVLREIDVVFACVDSVAAAASQSPEMLEGFDLVIVDECHHLGSATYDAVLSALSAGDGGTFLIGLTATPWRPDGADLSRWFDLPAASIDLVQGLRQGFLANVDYRMFTDNIRWESIAAIDGVSLTPKGINRTLFIEEWDDAVIDRLREAWTEVENPKAIVFCGTIDHAIEVAAKVNSLGFSKAVALHSRMTAGRDSVVQRNRVLWDFAEGTVGILTAVDILNEGVDVPDVNIVVFQRVTHSRRIFIQQLGRGLRITPGKEKVIVLDFVSDVRRIAAGLDLQSSLNRPLGGDRIRLGSSVSFMRHGQVDQSGNDFLREWLGDIEGLESAGDDNHILRFPPTNPPVG